MPRPRPRTRTWTWTWTRRAATTAVAAGLAAVLVAGCSSDDDPRAGTDVVVAPRDAVRDGGTLRWAVDAVPQTLNAFQAAADETTALVTRAVLPTLFRLDGRGRPSPDPDFLDSADVVAREPRQVVAYHLNPKAVWSDGRPVGVADFIAQWKALRGLDEAFWAARNSGYDRIADVRRGADAHDVRVTFREPYADWRSLFTPLYPRAVTGTADAFNTSARTALPAVAGPFAVQTVATDQVTLVRNTRWWGDRAKLDRLVLAAVPPARRPTAVAARRLDVAELDPDHLGKLRVRKTLAAANTQLTLNGGPGRPLADERVRRAVARAVNRRAIAEAVLKPLGLPAEPLGNHLVLAAQPDYADHSSALGSADAEGVRALLAEAGWRPTAATGAPSASAAAHRTSAAAYRTPAAAHQPSDRVASRPAHPSPHAPGAVFSRPAPAPPGAAAPGAAAPGAARAHRAPASTPPPGGATAAPALRKNGRPLTLRLVLPRDSAVLGRVGSRVTAQLAAVGIRTETVRVAGDGFFHDHIAAGDFDLALFTWPGTPYPATDNRPVYAKPRPAADGSLTIGLNYSRVGTDQIDQLLDQAAAELDPGAAHRLAARADARIWAAAGSVPLFQPPQLVALAPGVVNAGAFGFATPRYQDIGFRK